MAEWLSRMTYNQYHLQVMGSNPTRGTLGKVSKTCSSGRPKPCEGIWVVSWVADETQGGAIVRLPLAERLSSDCSFDVENLNLNLNLNLVIDITS